MASVKQADTAPARPYSPRSTAIIVTMPTAVIDIGALATKPAAENATAPGAANNWRYGLTTAHPRKKLERSLDFLPRAPPGRAGDPGHGSTDRAFSSRSTGFRHGQPLVRAALDMKPTSRRTIQVSLNKLLGDMPMPVTSVPSGVGTAAGSRRTSRSPKIARVATTPDLAPGAIRAWAALRTGGAAVRPSFRVASRAGALSWPP